MNLTTPPIAQSPLTDMHRRNGAVVELRDGWLIAAHYPDEPRAGANALVDFAHRPTWELNGSHVARKLTELCAHDVAARSIHAGEGWQAYRLTSARAIIFGMPAGEIDGILDVTGGWVSLVLMGPDAESILNKVSAVDVCHETLPVQACCQGPIFGVNTLFGRFTDRFELHVCGDSAEFLWEVLLDAGNEFGLDLQELILHTERMWRQHELKDRYDVVIIGGGVHGLATAYYLTRMGIRDVAVLEAKYIGFGGSGRNTAIVRSNYRTPEGIAFYDMSVKLYEELAADLDFNVMFSQHGHLTLAHNERGVAGLTERALVNQWMGVNSRIIFPDEIQEIVPDLNVFGHSRFPIMAALYRPPGGIIRHDAVVWAYARGVDRGGGQVHQQTEVTGIEINDGKVEAVVTNRGRIKTGTVVNATAGYAGIISRMAGLEIPIESHPLQACVTEPLKPFLNSVIVSSTLHVYVSQTDRGELVLGAEVDDYASYSLRGTLAFLEGAALHILELFPFLANVNVLRQWAGLCDMTPDYSPIMGDTPDLKGFLMTVGWGTYGFKAGPASGSLMAERIATGKTPEKLAPFSITRFYEDRLVGEKAAASVSH